MYAAMGYPLSSSITALLKVLDADRMEHYERITEQAKRAEAFDQLVNAREYFKKSKITNSAKRMRNVEYTHAQISDELAKAIQAGDQDRALDLCEDLKSIAASPEEIEAIDDIIVEIQDALNFFDGDDEDFDDNDEDFDDDDDDFDDDIDGENLASYAGDVPPGYISVKGDGKKRKEERRARKDENAKIRQENKKQNAENRRIKTEARAQLIKDRGEAKKTRANAKQTLADQGIGNSFDANKIVDAVGNVANAATNIAGGGAVGDIVGGLLGRTAQPGDAQNLTTMEAAKQPDTGGGMPVWGWILIGVGAVAVIGGAIWFFTRKKKTK